MAHIDVLAVTVLTKKKKNLIRFWGRFKSHEFQISNSKNNFEKDVKNNLQPKFYLTKHGRCTG